MKYLLAVLLIGSLFAQDTLKLKTNDILYIGKIEEIFGNRIKFTMDGEMFGNLVRVARIEYLATPDTVIIKHGKFMIKNTTFPMQWPQSGVLTKIGGALIVVSGLLNYSANRDAKIYSEGQTNVNLGDKILKKGELSAWFMIIGRSLIAFDQ